MKLLSPRFILVLPTIATVLLATSRAITASEPTVVQIPRPQITDVSDSSLPASLDVECDQDLLLKCSTFDVREVTVSNETLAKATVSVGNLQYFRVTGVAEGAVTVTVWPKDSAANHPVGFTVRIVPYSQAFSPLIAKISAELGVAVRIEPIPNSKKILVTGDVGTSQNAERVMAFIVSPAIPRDRLITKLTWKAEPCCVGTPCCSYTSRRCK